MVGFMPLLGSDPIRQTNRHGGKAPDYNQRYRASHTPGYETGVYANVLPARVT